MTTVPEKVMSFLAGILPAQQLTPGYESRTIKDAEVIEALFHQAKTGCAWADLPSCYPSKTTVFRRRAEWIEAGVFDALLGEFLIEPKGEMLTDATFIECKAPIAERDWTKIGDGLKLQAVTSKDGRFSFFSVGSARPHESKVLLDLMEEMDSLPSKLLGDAAYATEDLRSYAATRGCKVVTTAYYGNTSKAKKLTPAMRRALKIRWAIERSFAWLKSFLGVATCRSRSLATYFVGLSLAIATINSRIG